MKWKPYPSYSDTRDELLGSIPSHWKAHRLKHLADVRLSNVDKLSVDDQAIVRLANYVDVYKNERITADMDLMVATASDDQIERLTLAAQDVLITKDSESPNDIAVPAYVPEPMEGVVCGYHLALLRPDADRLHGGFLHRWLQGKASQAYFSSHANGMTRYGIGRGDIGDAPLLWAPLEEQKAINDFLDRETAKIDALIAEQRILIERLREKRQATIFHTVTNGLQQDSAMKASSIAWIGEIPVKWKAIKIKYVCRIESGHTPSKSQPEYWKPEECIIPWVSLNDTNSLANGDYISDTAIKISTLGMENSSAHFIESGAVVMNRDGARVGLTAITTMPMCVSQHMIAWVCSHAVYNKYLLYVLYAMNDELYRIAWGSTIPTIGMTDVNQMAMPLPPIEEQHAIIAFFEEEIGNIDNLIREAETSIALLQEHRSALITAVVTGKVDVRGLVDGVPA